MRKHLQRIAAAAALAATLVAASPAEVTCLDMARCPHAIRQVG